MNLFKKTLFMFVTALVSFTVNADWKKEVYKDFSGEIKTYYVNKSKNGAELVVDVQQNHIAFVHRKTVINYVNGIKLDGVFYKQTGRSGGGDDFSDAVFITKAYSLDVWNAFLDAKKIEVNIEYFRVGDRVSTFTNSKSLRKSYPSQFSEE